MYKMSQMSRNLLALNVLKNICMRMLEMRAGSFPDKHIRQLIIKQFNVETGMSIFDVTSPKSIDSGYFEFLFCAKFNGNRVLLTEKHNKTEYITLKFTF
jgi:hypothetical protein